MSQHQHSCPQCGNDMKRTETKDAHGPVNVFNCSPCGVSFFEAPKAPAEMRGTVDKMV